MRKWKLVVLLVAVLAIILPAAVLAGPQPGDIVFTVGQAAYWTDGQSHLMGAAPVLINGQVYLPANDVAQAIGESAKWVPELQEVVFVSPPKPTIISGDIEREIVNGTVPAITTIPVSLRVTGPNGSRVVQGSLDTGSSLTVFPDDYLQGLGFQPCSNIQSGTTVQDTFEYRYYQIPYPEFLQNGKSIPLGSGKITVMGVIGGNKTLVGIDILSADNLALHENNWTLTLPTTN